MKTMTKAQKDYINQVILPTIIDMAINDKLDSDMTLLSYHDFEEATEKYNDSPEQKKARAVKALGEYMSPDEYTVEEMYDTLVNFKGEKDEQLCSIEGIEPAEGYEFWCINFLWERLPS